MKRLLADSLVYKIIYDHGSSVLTRMDPHWSDNRQDTPFVVVPFLLFFYYHSIVKAYKTSFRTYHIISIINFN